MKPPWYPQAADAELEALQTDVMRFVAILGLCLAAIFSLVHSASPIEAVAPVSPPSAGETSAQVPVARSQPRPVAPAPAPSPAPEQIGFSLEFDSAEVLTDLLESGKLQLFARVGEQFWGLDAAAKSFAVASPPASYHRMQVDTVPAFLRRKLQRTTAATVPEWGVQLPPQMLAQLRQIMEEQAGGKLLIQSNGDIHIDSAVPPIR